MDCIFCKITSGVIPTNFVAESQHAVAFKDISPRQPVHILVVPKEHYTDVADLTDKNPEVLSDLMQLVAKVAKDKTIGSFRLTFNTGAAAGQTVFHAHAHITSTTPKEL
ncbi:MAG: HIT domain-containing protein [Micrococcales bacterium]|nr:HIT domain-containing protein [Micrococcales bacterium]NBT48200.1 HIT domain-containing protein [Actinomycetota bacterium]NBY43716.1 HIT domain-containing protein [Micrococcales bacterium]NDE88664.1 HIT domain-containing protein [Micrococcales bacterium]